MRTPQDPTEEATGTVDEPRKRRPSPASRARRIGGAAPRPNRPERAPDETTNQANQAAAAPAATTATAEPAEPAERVALSKPAPRPEPAPSPALAASEPKASRSVPVRWLPAGILAVAVVALLAVVVIFSHGVYWAKKSDSAGARTVAQEQVLAAAKKCFVQINSYDYRQLDGLVQKDLACTTGTFTADLKKALQTQILKLAPRLHARQTAQVNKAGITSVSPGGGQVTVLIFGQFSVNNDKTAKNQPRVDVVGAVVTVDKVHGTWLISKVDADVPNT